MLSKMTRLFSIHIIQLVPFTCGGRRMKTDKDDGLRFSRYKNFFQLFETVNRDI